MLRRPLARAFAARRNRLLHFEEVREEVRKLKLESMRKRYSFRSENEGFKGFVPYHPHQFYKEKLQN